MVETTALGAAGLAGLATGVWSNPEEFAVSRSYDRFTPGMRADDAYVAWRRAVEAALYWARNGR
jgi:glycerol kinase